MGCISLGICDYGRSHNLIISMHYIFVELSHPNYGSGLIPLQGGY